MEWQPIETAPKDGTVILLWDPSGETPWVVAMWSADDRPFVNEFGPFVWLVGANPRYSERIAENVPTHWMPMPEPPHPGPRRGEEG